MNDYTARLALLTAVVLLWSPASSLAKTPNQQDIAALTDEIVIKELDLFKLNASTKINAMPHSPWAARRWAAIGATNGALTTIGALQTGAGRFYWLNTTKRAPNNYFATAARSRVIANCITVGGSAFELAADVLSGYREHRHGTDLASARRNAADLTKEIDELLLQRSSAVKALDWNEPERTIAQREGAVLQDLRDMGDNEFARFYAQAKSARFTRNLGYIISMISNAESGVGSAYASLYAPYQTQLNSRVRTRNGGVGGICDIISGGLNVSAPFLNRAGGALERMSARSAVCKDLDVQQIDKMDQLQQHQNELLSMLKDKPILTVKAELLHQQAVKSELGILVQHAAMRKSEQKAARHRFIENVINSGVSGGTKIANGVGGTMGAFRYTKDAHARFLTTGEVAITYGAGNAFSTMETLRNQFWNELTSKRARDHHTSAKQILKDQIAELDAQKAAIKDRTNAKFAGAPNQGID